MRDIFEEVFNSLAEQEEIHYNKEEHNVFGLGLSKLPITIHTLEIDFEGISIYLKYDLGNHNLAEIRTVFTTIRKRSNFSLFTKEPFLRLFSFKQGIWKIKCENKNEIRILEQLLRVTGLSELAKTEAFEPQIHGTSNDLEYTIEMRYYLGFNHKEKSIKPVVEFMKRLILHLKN